MELSKIDMPMSERLKELSKQPLLSEEDKAELIHYLGYSVSDEVLRKREFEFLEYLTGRRNCIACKNCENCTSKARGYVCEVDCMGNISYRPCKRFNAFLVHSKINNLIGQAKIPAAYNRMSFESFNPKWVKGGSWLLGVAKKAVQPGTSGIYFTGKPGVGKTHLAISILKEWLHEGRAGTFVTLPTLMQSLRKGIDDRDLDKRIEIIQNIDLLVLDDFGTEKVTEWTSEQLFIIVNERYINDKKTIVTSNLTMEQAEKRLEGGGERICSRLMGMCDVVAIEASDYRIFGGNNE